MKLKPYSLSSSLKVASKGFLVGLIVGAILAASLAYCSNCQIGYNISIPNGDMIKNYCKDNGYETGWLSSFSCGINEVMCHKKIGKANYNECIEWN